MTSAQVAEAVFDSHRFVKRLTEAGMEEGLAEVLAEEHMGPWIRNVATRTDVADIGEGLERTRVMFRKDLENAEANIRKDAATKADVATVRKDLENLRKDAATKADVATVRKDLENLRKDAATKADVAMVRKDLENLRKDAATKADLAVIRKDLENIRRDFATKADVANAIAAAERRLMLAMIGVAGVLFAALRLTQ